MRKVDIGIARWRIILVCRDIGKVIEILAIAVDQGHRTAEGAELHVCVDAVTVIATVLAEVEALD